MNPRPKIIQFLSFLIIYMVAEGSAFSQSRNFAHFGVKDGLSQNTVFSVTQDASGNMWFATYDGVDRFDGYHFRSYLLDSPEESKIKNYLRVPYVLTLTPMSASLWCSMKVLPGNASPFLPMHSRTGMRWTNI